MALATRDTVSNLWVHASLHGSASLRVPDRAAAFNLRNKLHAYRREMRRQGRAHTGFDASSYDNFKVLYRPELDLNLYPTGYWLVFITTQDYVEFELLGPSDNPSGNPNSPTETPDGEESQKASASEEVDEAPWGEDPFEEDANASEFLLASSQFPASR